MGDFLLQFSLTLEPILLQCISLGANDIFGLPFPTLIDSHVHRLAPLHLIKLDYADYMAMGIVNEDRNDAVDDSFFEALRREDEKLLHHLPFVIVLVKEPNRRSTLSFSRLEYLISILIVLVDHLIRQKPLAILPDRKRFLLYQRLPFIFPLDDRLHTVYLFTCFKILRPG